MGVTPACCYPPKSDHKNTVNGEKLSTSSVFHISHPEKNLKNIIFTLSACARYCNPD